MKKLSILAVMAVLIFACKQNSEPTEAAKTPETKPAEPVAEAIIYPYAPKKPYRDWEIGSQKNSVLAMNGLKSFENGDIAGTLNYFADSCQMVFDGYDAKLDKKGMEKFFSDERARYSNMKVVMQDWVTVMSKDKSEEWVTLWYKQINTMKNGKVDSVNVVNDLKFANGKVVILDEKTQHFPPAKK